MERCFDLAGDAHGLARTGSGVHRFAVWDGRVIGAADALSAAMSREIPGPRKAKGADDAAISASIADASPAESFVIVPRTFNARYHRNLGLEFAISAFCWRE